MDELTQQEIQAKLQELEDKIDILEDKIEELQGIELEGHLEGLRR